MFVHFSVARMRYIEAFECVLIHQSNPRLNYFIDMFCSNKFQFKYLGMYQDVLIDLSSLDYFLNRK